MNLLDWILNLAGLVLWIEWRSGRPLRRNPSVLSLASAIRPAEARRGGGFAALGALLVLLFLRPFFYWSIGAKLQWTAQTDLLAISLPWRSDLLDRMFLYSTISFGIAFGLYYSCLLLLSAINRAMPDDNPVQRFIRVQLGWLEKIPWWLKVALPMLVTGFAWIALVPLVVHLELLPPLQNYDYSWGQAAALSLTILLVWKWLLLALFLFHLLNLYVYLGKYPLWDYISITARKLLWPVSFFAVGRIDLSPVIGIGLVFFVAELGVKPGMIRLFERFMP
ncbi:MAG TPA: hypothetical protein VGR78_16345 [Verrucomicrobiae bacterium]|jgi:hypothetical protein|nr:hypothetical protein [Verrucomicrobiae bacterium]